jgi:hypothetical protein
MTNPLEVRRSKASEYFEIDRSWRLVFTFAIPQFGPLLIAWWWKSYRMGFEKTGGDGT